MIPNLRDRPPKMAKKEKHWNNRCYRISTYNTQVHSHFRTLFESIGKND